MAQIQNSSSVRAPHLASRREHAALALAIIRSLRGSSGQAGVTSKLGLSANKISKWETGRTQIRWTQFVAYARFFCAPLSEALEKVFGYEVDPSDWPGLVRRLALDASVETIAESLGVSSLTVRRWLAGVSEPSLCEICSLIDFQLHLLPEFAATFIDLTEFPSLLRRHHQSQGLGKVMAERPWIFAMLTCLELPNYLRTEGGGDLFLANFLNVSLEEIREALHQMVHLGALSFVNDRYVPTQQELDVTPLNRSMRDHFKYFWSLRVTEFLKNGLLPKFGFRHGIQTVAVSSKASFAIELKLRSTFDDIFKIVRDDQPNSATTVCYVGLTFADVRDVLSVLPQSQDRDPSVARDLV